MVGVHTIMPRRREVRRGVVESFDDVFVEVMIARAATAAIRGVAEVIGHREARVGVSIGLLASPCVLLSAVRVIRNASVGVRVLRWKQSWINAWGLVRRGITMVPHFAFHGILVCFGVVYSSLLPWRSGLHGVVLGAAVCVAHVKHGVPDLLAPRGVLFALR